MNRSFALIIASVCLAAATLGGIASCRQGEGQKCQVDADCESGLICTGEDICASSESSQFDAFPIPDAPLDGPPDAFVPDAPDAAL